MKAETYIQDLVLKAVTRAGFSPEHAGEVSVMEPKQKGHGDLAVNIALILASREKKNPREIAAAIVKELPSSDSCFSQIEIAGPGFINFTLSDDWLRQGLAEILEQQAAYGNTDIGRDKTVQVEFVSANPTGPLTIGHGRQAVIGDTIARMLEQIGYDVTREYYFNNAGRQMRMLGESVMYRYRELLGETSELTEDHYQGEYIIDIAREALEEKGDALRNLNDVSYFQALAEERIFNEIKNTVARLGIRFDVFYNETSLYETGKIDDVIAALKKKELVYEADGALWFRTTAFGQETDKVILKSSGEPTYRLPDIAYHRDKIERGFDMIIDIFGSDHVATYPDVLAGIGALGYDSGKIHVLIHQFVTLMEGNEKVKMSTRKANFVTLDELIDDVGADVTRYFFINRSMNSHLNFDLALARTESDENPVYYVQYAHARICSILEHAGERGVDLAGGTPDLSLLTAREEMDLIRKLLNWPAVLQQAAEAFEPHKIPVYLEETATVYHRFQHAGKVDGAMRVVTDDEDLTRARLALCDAARIVLSNGLDVLGISSPSRM
ncbi:arginine--tRNA ligase [bacterium]|nr:arginine--tRNA ligase [bacterium]